MNPERPDEPTAPFVHRTPACRVVFGAGSIDQLPAGLAELGIRRPMLLSGRRTAASALHAAVREALAGLPVVRFDTVPAHGSVAVVEQLVSLARQEAVDGFVAVGGGSASDTAKATALWLAEGGTLEQHASCFTPPDRLVIPPLRAPKRPIVAVPGTASAAEVTPGLGVRTTEGRKLLFTDPQLAARLILIDPRATRDVPTALLLSTGFNGLAHCLEGLYARVRTPVSTALALHGTALFLRALPRLGEQPDSEAARGDLLVAAHLSGQVLLNARTALHHAVCHALGAATGVAHGDANTVMLPETLAFNRPDADAPLAEAARAAGLPPRAEALIEALRRLRERLGLPQRLRELGIARAALPAIAAATLHERGLFFNPRRVTEACEIEQLLGRAW